MIPVELLAPAKDAECGRAAIDCGADAVYVGAGRFGARENAGNSLDDIAVLTEYAHRFWARVYVTVNTLLHDHELPHALDLIRQLHAIGIDGLIIQDTGLLESDLPPLPLIASTQMHNHSPEKVAFLERVGFQRAILARELSLEDLRAVRAAAPSIELECFVHGALCVCYSGQCTMSYALGGRSGNRGQCAQPCRRSYTLVDARGRVWARDKHLLSLRDLNLSEALQDLLDAGITSFKIEGRLKDKAYVSNVVAHYRNRLDAVFTAHPGKWRKSASGISQHGFVPNPSKTFNRGYTTYFLSGRAEDMAAHDTPKMLGEPLGRVKALNERIIVLEDCPPLAPGDGVCFFDAEGQLRGSLVNAAANNRIELDKVEGLTAGTPLFRNHDHAFLRQIERAHGARRVSVGFTLFMRGAALVLRVEDEDGAAAEVVLPDSLPPAGNPERAIESLRKQLMKTGGTMFACRGVDIQAPSVPFMPVAFLNGMRRELLEHLMAQRAAMRPRAMAVFTPNDVPYPEKHLSFRGNVLNRAAARFYRRHGVERIEPAAESGLDLRGRPVMITRYCLRHALGLCRCTAGSEAPAEPLSLIDGENTRFELEFDCATCHMHVYFGAKKEAVDPA